MFAKGRRGTESLGEQRESLGSHPQETLKPPFSGPSFWLLLTAAHPPITTTPQPDPPASVGTQVSCFTAPAKGLLLPKQGTEQADSPLSLRTLSGLYIALSLPLLIG